VLGAAASNIDGSLGDINVFLQLSWTGIFGTERFPLDNGKVKLQEVFCSKTNSISEGNNVLYTPASTIHGFLWRGTCFSSNQLNRPIWNKEDLSRSWKLWMAGRFPFKN
jgi:hypothetical protein